jgi:hypothetical protein
MALETLIADLLLSGVFCTTFIFLIRGFYSLFSYFA